MQSQNKISIFDDLIHSGAMSEAELIPLLQEAEQRQVILWEILQEKGLDFTFIAQKIATHLRLSYVELSVIKQALFIKNIIEPDYIEQNGVLPLYIEADTLFLAITESTHLMLMDELKFSVNLNISMVVVAWDQLNHFIKQYLQTFQVNTTLGLTKNANGEVITILQGVFVKAVKQDASDLHFEPYQTAYRIRIRVDGVLHPIAKLSLELAERFITRIKILSQLDIAEKRLPQDGRFTLELSGHQSRDCRVSICPTLQGEKVVVRILNVISSCMPFESLGLDSLQQILFKEAIFKPQGMILITGPTGSGKTMTLYTALQLLNAIEKNICTVEDPVEIQVSGFNQVPINPKTDLSFSKVLRAFLRQDPDIIMVGEIRDKETADIAMRAAQTGHLVLSTLHANSAAETISRLQLMGVSAFNLAHSIHMIIAQRLVRKICHQCQNKRYDENSACSYCIRGYRGRVGIFECMPMTPEIIKLIISNRTATEIAAEAQKLGMIDLRESAMHKIKLGITTLSEIKRVLG
ncbi:MAG: ATPase, T2SS/T4P/T4SS family [Gammaproteobacteria bacterium]